MLCRTVHGVQKGCEGGQRKLSAMLICNGLTRMGCAAEVNAAKYYLSSQLWAQKRSKMKGKKEKIIIQGHVQG